MLALMRRLRGGDGRAHSDDDAGVALVIVVILMFLGLIVASSIAMMVISTIEANGANKQTTQSFVTAESWRDTAVAQIAKGIDTGDGTLACSGSYSIAGSTATNGATVRWAEDSTEPEAWSSLDAGAATYTACPTDTSNWVVIHSTGTAGDSTDDVDSVYAWSKQPDTRPAGTLAYFDGEFTATKTTYTGDLVVRGTDNYKCNNSMGNAIQGDLWVTNASVEVTGDCYVTGSIYAYGYVQVKNHNFHVGGDVVTLAGDVDLEANGVVIGGDIYAGKNVTLTKYGTIGNGKTLKAGCGINAPSPTSCTAGAIPAAWTHVDGSAITPTPNQGQPTITPTLTAVHDATAWLELDSSKGLSDDSDVYPNATVTNVCSGAALKSILETAGTRAYIDMSACVSGGSITVQPAAAAVARDAMIYVPPTSSMSVKLTNNLSVGAGDPELLIVHGDSNVADDKPTPCTTTPASDSLQVSATISVRTLLYSACGVNNTMSLTMKGQLYMGTDGLHLNGGTFTCAPMGWVPALKNLSCGVKGDDGIFDPDKTTQLIGSLTRQAER